MSYSANFSNAMQREATDCPTQTIERTKPQKARFLRSSITRYSSTDDVVVTPDPNTMASIVMSTQSTIDLLTNRKLISVERVKARRPELEEYERRRAEFFSKCQ